MSAVPAGAVHAHDVDGPAGPSLDDLAAAATRGDDAALAELVRQVQHPLYRLALRFLGDPHDAQDATQEILARVVTRLSTFEGRSAFMTWAYAVATRHLLRARRRAVEASVRGPVPFGTLLDAGLDDRDFTAEEAEYRQLCEEVRISCTYGMLLCLGRDQRAAYLLGDVIGLTDAEAAPILDVTPAAFRQRLARARRTLRAVIDNRCGLVDPANPCRCGRQIRSGIEVGYLDRARLPLSTHARTSGDGPARARLDAVLAARAADQIDTAVAIGELYRADRFAAPPQLWEHLRTRLPDLLPGPGDVSGRAGAGATRAP
ncbi:RNA polymerase sigma factor [Kineosporia sp. A_224]|uniref:RNA polymerase sigma factor n=1 Tax=Kineosporia sp. A_224 TaxID=1962180 RepID=UPI0013040DB5|nr:RNA polymerase sigma factor [Kineosporia sp. A_224]